VCYLWQSINSQPIMELECLLLWLQYPILNSIQSQLPRCVPSHLGSFKYTLILSLYLTLSLSNGFFPWRFLTEVSDYNSFYSCTFHAPHISLFLTFFTLVVLQIIKYKIMHFVYSTVGFSILSWEVPLRTLFSNTLRA